MNVIGKSFSRSSWVAKIAQKQPNPDYPTTLSRMDFLHKRGHQKIAKPLEQIEVHLISHIDNFTLSNVETTST